MFFSTSENPLAEAANEFFGAPKNGQPESYAIPGSEKEGRSPVYRHWKIREGPLLETLDPKVRTAHEMFESGAARYPNNNCLGWRPFNPVTKTYGQYQWMDYKTVQERRANFGAGIVEVHRRLGEDYHQRPVGLWIQNRPEWHIVDLGCQSQSLFTVSLYETLGPDTTEYIINLTQQAVVATSLTHIPTLLKSKPRIPSLKALICLDPLDTPDPAGTSRRDIIGELARNADLELYSVEDVEQLGSKLKMPYLPPKPSDLVTINFTSGTTGMPKGVILTHRNCIASCSNSIVTSGAAEGSVMLSYLPLAHIYGRLVEQGVFWVGGAIGFFHGVAAELAEDLRLLRPTTFPSVPRLYTRFGTLIKANAVEVPGLKGAISRRALEAKLSNLEPKDRSVKPTDKHMLYDRLWTNRIRAGLGFDRLQVMVTGSAPIDPSLHQFLRAALGARFVQGFGMTETYGSGIVQTHEDLSAGHCGAVHPAVEVCLLSLPEMGYLTTDKPSPRGELLLRGPIVTSGYYKNEEETAKSFTEDGWFCSGDVAEIDEKGHIKVIDRRKNILKLAQGEYVSPERIENIYANACGYLTQPYVHGDSVKTHLVAIAGVDPVLFAPVASRILHRTVDPNNLTDVEAAARDPAVTAAVLEDLEKAGLKAKLNGYERVRNIALRIEPFTIEDDHMTPTLKFKRPKIVKSYRDLLDELYATCPPEPPKAKL
ncbi:hypothetical protein KEM54_000030 [Ascosphaera aggregata]|nr:hypothetical protein KEM54_000030 [Ascosphaera aggregata]